MKILLLAIVILILTTGIVLWESIFVSNLTTTLIGIVEQMPSHLTLTPESSSQDFAIFQHAYLEFQKNWNTSKHWLYLFVGHTETDRIEFAFQEAGVRYLTKDTSGYLCAIKKLIAELEKLRDLEKLSFGSFM